MVMTDDLAPARGCLIAALTGAAIWAAAIASGIAIFVACWQVIP